MVTLDIVVPSKGRSKALLMQLMVLKGVLDLSKCYRDIRVSVYVSVNASNELFDGLIKRYPEILFHFNNVNLGFDKNVLTGICLTTADYIHVLSDNDYRSFEYWQALFGQLEKLGIDNKYKASYPLMFVPVAKELNKAINTYPDWYAAGISKLCSSAEIGASIYCDESDQLLASILQATSQISHVIIRRNDNVQASMRNLVKSEENNVLVNTGLPQSVYFLALVIEHLKQAEQVCFKPFTTPCLLAFVPELHRSAWFYDSTFIGQRRLYSVTKEEFRLPLGIKNLSPQIISFLDSVGYTLLLQDCVYHSDTNISRWLERTNKSPSEIERYRLEMKQRIAYKAKKTLAMYLKNLPTFVIRYFAIILIFKYHNRKKTEA